MCSMFNILVLLIKECFDLTDAYHGSGPFLLYKELFLKLNSFVFDSI